jgi:hypothetical protein
MEVVVLILLAWAVKSAYEDTKKAWGKSKAAYMRSAEARFPRAPKHRRTLWALRHDAGYLASQALHGFPVSRHGFAYGWHEGRREHAERRAAREQAKAERLEAEAVLEPQVTGYRQRQRAARDDARAARRAARQRPPGEGREGSGEGSDPASGNAPEPGASPGAQPDGRSWSYTSAANPLAWPADDEGHARSQASYWSTSGKPQVVHEYPAGGGPGKLVAAYLNGEEITPTAAQVAAWDAEADVRRRQQGRASALGAAPALPPADPCANCTAPGCGCACHAKADGTAPSGPARQDLAGKDTQVTTTEGTAPMAADVTYDGVLTSMARAKADAEGRAAEQQQAAAQASVMADLMQALEVDPATLSAVADHLDAHDAATKAQARVFETAEAVDAALKRGHAGLNQAHQDAPVTAADKSFYEG